jgi:hypothetical protein
VRSAISLSRKTPRQPEVTEPRSRVVRTTQRFFDYLDQQVPETRSASGEPSTYDFLTLELPGVIDVFAEQFHELPELIPGRADYRIYTRAGVIAPIFTITGVLGDDEIADAIEQRMNGDLTRGRVS